MKRLVSFAAALALPVLLTGCSLQTTASPSAQAGSSLRGIVHGGQQPVAGAHVYLLAANTTGYGGNGILASSSNASISLLTTATGHSDSVGNYVLTGTDGSFTVTNDYTCTPGQEVYLYALGGNPGAGTNSAAGFLAVGGPCPTTGTFPSTNYVWMNEVSTVAAAYALAGFATDATHISSSGTALAQTGIANAVASTKNLVNQATGAALATTVGSNGNAPQAKINTLANILAACINSTGPTSGSCSNLFNNAKSAGTTGTAATDTATAAINIAHNPFTSYTSLYSLQAGVGSPFQPDQASADINGLLSISYYGYNLSSPTDLAVDKSGNIWIANPGNNSLTELAPTGYFISTAPGYTGGGLDEPNHLAIDSVGNVWVSNLLNNSVSVFTSAGAPLTGSNGITGGGLNQPKGIAIDGLGNIWTANYGNNSISKLSSAGAVLSGSGFTGGGLNEPNRIGIDGSGNVWVSNYGGNVLSKFANTGIALSGTSGFTGGGLNLEEGIAIDGSGNAWVANYGNNSLSEFSNAGLALSGSGFMGGGLDGPASIGFDGGGNLWVADYVDDQPSEFSSTGAAITPATLQPVDSTDLPAGSAIDGSGNIWAPLQGSNQIIELVGAAVPVVTPICAGLPAVFTGNGSSSLGTRP